MIHLLYKTIVFFCCSWFNLDKELHFYFQKNILKDEEIDDLLSWLVLLSQDPRVINCSLKYLFADTICHALELYSNFNVRFST